MPGTNYIQLGNQIWFPIVLQFLNCLMQHGLNLLLGAFAENGFAAIVFIYGRNVCLQIDC